MKRLRAVWPYLLVWSILIGVGTLAQYKLGLRDRKAYAETYLKTVAELKVERFGLWLQGRQADLQSLAGNPLLQAALLAPQPNWSEIEVSLEATRKSLGYHSMVLIRSDTGQTLAGRPIDTPTRELVERAAKQADPVVGPFQNESRGVYQLALARQVCGPWVLVGTASTDTRLQGLFETWPVPSATGEILLVERRGDRVWFLTSPQGHEDTTDFSLPLNLPDLPAALGVQGFQGFVEGHDYGGQPVCAAVLAVPDTPWCIVAKQNREEALNLPDLYRDLGYTLGAGAVVGLLLALLVWSLSLSRFYRRVHAADLKIMEATALTRAVLEQAPDMIFVLGEKGLILQANPSAQEFYHLKPGQSALPDLLSPEQFAQSRAGHTQLRSSRGGVSVEILVTPLNDQMQAEMLVVGRNLSERQHWEAERARLLTRLQAKNKEMESILYITSHDLRSPLVNIQGFAERIERGLARLKEILEQSEVPIDLRPEVSEWFGDKFPKSLGFIKASTDKMDALIAGLLKVSRAGRAKLTHELLDMEELLKSVFGAQAHQLESVGATAELGPLPPCRADRAALNQVFSNLLDNAIKYRDPERPLQISVSGEVEGDLVVYRFRDSGIGIEPHNQARIFDMFTRLQRLPSVSGEGLGLTLALQLVQRHGGNLTVQSQPGVGTTFLMALPNALEMFGGEAECSESQSPS